MRRHTTTQLLNMIRKGKSMEVFKDCEEDIDNPTLSDFLREQMEKKNIKIGKLASEIMLDRTFVYQIINGVRMPNRGHLLRIAFAMQLSFEETQCMLRLAKRGELYPRIRFDAALIYAIQKKFTLAEVDEMLTELGEKTLL